MELNMDVTNLTTQKAWKLRNNKVKFDIVLNLRDAQIEPTKPHKIAKVVWATFKLMYEHLDKTTIVVLDFFFPNLK
jgi:hypothetical protein